MLSSRSVAALLVASLTLAAGAAAADHELDALRREATAAYVASDTERARAAADRVLARQPDDPEMLTVVGMLDFSAARRLGAEDDPDAARVAMAKARERLERAARLSPELPQPALFALAVAAVAADEPAAAMAPLGRFLERAPDGYLARRLRARCQRQLGALAAAEADLRRVVALRPGLAGPALELADLQAIGGRERDALATLWQAVEALAADASSDDRWGLLKQIHVQAMRIPDLVTARRAIDRARRELPQEIQARYFLGVLLYRQEEHDAAWDELAVALHSDDLRDDQRAEAHFRRGLIASHRGELAAARVELAAAIAAAPRKTEALQALASVELRDGQRGEAQATLARFRAAVDARRPIDALRAEIANAPHAIDGYRRLIALLLELNDAVAAEQVVEVVRARLPHSPEVERLAATVARARSSG